MRKNFCKKGYGPLQRMDVFLKKEVAFREEPSFKLALYEQS